MKLLAAAALAFMAASDAEGPAVLVTVRCVDGLPVLLELQAVRPGQRRVEVVDLVLGCEALQKREPPPATPI